MGGTISSIFSGKPAGTNDNGDPVPTWEQKMGQGMLKGVGTGVAKSLQPQPAVGGGLIPNNVQAPVVNPAYFTPTSSPFYG